MWKQPLTIMAGHANPDKGTFGRREWQYAEAVASGQVQNDRYFAYIATLDPEDDPMDESAWPKANPNIGVSKPMEYMQKEAVFATRDPERMAWFQHLHLNLWEVRETKKQTTAP